MDKAPKLIYLLRKSTQAEGATVPVLNKNDFPLRFCFKGQEVVVNITQKGNIEITKHRLAGTDGK